MIVFTFFLFYYIFLMIHLKFKFTERASLFAPSSSFLNLDGRFQWKIFWITSKLLKYSLVLIQKLNCSYWTIKKLNIKLIFNYKFIWKLISQKCHWNQELSCKNQFSVWRKAVMPKNCHNFNKWPWNICRTHKIRQMNK